MPVLLSSLVLAGTPTTPGASFPDSPLQLNVRAAFGADLTADPDTWVWTDLTCAHPGDPNQTISRLLSTPISIKRGIAVGGSQQQTTSATVHCLNLDGALTPELVSSPYWPYVDAGTPFQLNLRTQPDLVDEFTRPAVSNGWGTATSGELWGSESLASAFSTNSTQGLITHTTNNTSRWIRSPRYYRNCDILMDVSMVAVATGGTYLLGPEIRSQDDALTRLWCTIEPGLLGVVVLKVRKFENTPTSTTIATVTVPALTYSGGTVLRLRVRVVDDSVRMRAWLAAGSEPSTWHVDITQTFVTGLEGGVPDGIGIRDSLPLSNTNTLPVVYTVDNFTVSEAYFPRLEGYIADVRPVFLPQSDGTTWSTVQIDVGGIGSRLEKNQSPAYSPLRRSVQLADLPPIAYWPLEDAEGSTFGASAYPGGPKMVVAGPAVFSFSQGTPFEVYLSRYGTKPMVSVAAGASLTALVPKSAVNSEWAVSFVVDCFEPDVPAISEMRIVQWETSGGTHNRWAVVAIEPGYQVRAYNDAAATSTNVATYSTATFTGQFTITVEAAQNGGNVDVALFANDVSIATGSAAGTLAAVTRVTVNPDSTNTTASVTPAGLKFVVGHVRVTDETSVHDTPFYAVSETGVTVSAIYAWYQEPAHRRLERLCDEEQVPFSFLGAPGEDGSTLLNAQQDGSFTELTTAAVEAESGGLLYEAAFGYKYLPRAIRYNAPVALTIDLADYKYSSGTDPADVLVPQLDSRGANSWTIQRTNGSTGSYAADAAYRQRRGTIAEERTLDVLTDDTLDDHAAWRTHVNVDGRGANYPAIPVDLAANPDLIETYLACDIGSRVQRLNQPTIAGAGTIDQVIEGVTETISPTVWQATLAATPGTVWDVFVVEDDRRGKAGTDATITHASATSSATTITIDVTEGPRWTTDAGEMPINISAVETGEDMQVTAISGTSNPQTLTVVRSVNGISRAIPAGTAIIITDASPLGL